MREIVHIQAGQCGNQIGAKVRTERYWCSSVEIRRLLSVMNACLQTRPYIELYNLKIFCAVTDYPVTTDLSLWLLNSVNIVFCCLCIVLGGDIRWAWHWSDWHLPRRLWSTAGAHQRLLQRGYRYNCYDILIQIVLKSCFVLKIHVLIFWGFVHYWKKEEIELQLHNNFTDYLQCGRLAVLKIGGTFEPENFRSKEPKFQRWNFRPRKLLSLGTSFLGTFVPWHW